jgi:hypothetical protein
MPLGIITEEELLAELNKGTDVSNQQNNAVSNQHDPSRPNNTSIMPLITPGRPEGKGNIPDVVKKVIAEEFLNGASHKEITAAFNVSQPVTTASAKGLSNSSPGAEINPELKNHVVKIRNRIVRKASNKLTLALDQITQDKLNDLSPRDSSAIAKDMSQIIRNLEPEKEGGGKGNSAQFIYFAPQQKSLNDYDVVTVKD